PSFYPRKPGRRALLTLSTQTLHYVYTLRLCTGSVDLALARPRAGCVFGSKLETITVVLLTKLVQGVMLQIRKGWRLATESYWWAWVLRLGGTGIPNYPKVAMQQHYGLKRLCALH